MSKLFQAFLSGVFFTFFIDFFFFLGLMLNYIDHYEINIYYNALFADHQNIFVFLFGVILLGYLTIYAKGTKLKLTLFSFIFILSMLPLIPNIGKSIGKMMFLKENVTLKDSRFTYNGNILYNGRENITFYDKGIKKTILLDKKDLK